MVILPLYIKSSTDQITLHAYRNNNCLRVDGDSVVVDSTGDVIVACMEVVDLLSVCRNTATVVKEWLSIIGVAISLLSLVTTLITYAVHPQLRAGPGLNVISLSISLFLAQSTFLANTSALHNHVLCACIGALQHYFWLVAFCWMNVMAIDIWKVKHNLLLYLLIDLFS